MNELEFKILEFIREHFTCAFLDFSAPLVSLLGDGGIFLIILSVILIAVPKTRKTGISMGAALLMGLIVANLILKNCVARVRPYDLKDGIELIVNRLGDYSFPSGHTVAAFEGATVLSLCGGKRIGIPAFVIALLIALSRLYLFVHYPTDVLAGALIGTAIGLAACFVTDKAYEKISTRIKK